MIAGEIERLKTQLEKASGELAAIRRQVERMAAHQSKTLAEPFDMFRLSKSKQAVDLAPNTIRSYIDQG
jgi:ABC-type phosphate transport system auxiliary subunit